MRRTKGVVQRTGHPHDHGNANRCEHVGHLKVLVGGEERRHDDSTAIIPAPV